MEAASTDVVGVGGYTKPTYLTLTKHAPFETQFQYGTRLYFGMSHQRADEVLSALKIPRGHVVTIVTEARRLLELNLPMAMVNILSSHYGLKDTLHTRLHLCLSETLINALEHGTLELGRAKQDMLNTKDYYADYAELLQQSLEEEGKGDKLITVQLFEHDGLLFISVEDEGRGFAFEDIVTSRMSKLEHGDITCYGGLGLATMSKLVESIHFENGGRRIVVSLPFECGSSVINYEQDLQKCRLLLVDDQPSNLTITQKLLEKAGFKNIDTAQNGEEALVLCREHSYDLVFLDVLMPDMDGFEVCSKLKTDEVSKHIPIIFMTALSEQENISKGFDMGAVDYIEKPVAFGPLKARAEVHLKNGLLLNRLKTFSKTMEDELKEALEFQTSLFPSKHDTARLGEQYGLEVESLFMPSMSIAGDYWQVFPVDKCKFGVLLADFMGHGVVSAFNTVRLHSILSELVALKVTQPKKMVENLGRYLRRHIPVNHFATGVYALVDTKKKVVTYTGFGAPGILHISDENKPVIHDCSGIPLGLIDVTECGYEEKSITYKVDDTLLFFSDALTEETHINHKRWGNETLLNITAKELGDGDKLKRFSSLYSRFSETIKPPMVDDLTLVGLTF